MKFHQIPMIFATIIWNSLKFRWDSEWDPINTDEIPQIHQNLYELLWMKFQSRGMWVDPGHPTANLPRPAAKIAARPQQIAHATLQT